MAKKSSMSMMNMDNTYVNVALLFAWIPIYGLFGTDGMMSNIMYMFNDPTGFMSLAIYLGPLVAMYVHGRVTSLLYFVPLVWNVMDYAKSVADDASFWGFWVSLVISFYASIQLARTGDMMRK